MRLKLRLALELERLRRKNLKHYHPLQQLFWESTLRCNVACRHCGSDCKASEHTPDMPFEDFLKVVDSITPHVNPRDVLIIISGGEPLVREDLAQNGRELMRRGYPWGMVTNGLYLTEEKLKELLDAGLRSITVSLDGLEEEHNWLRRHPDSWKKASEAIRLLSRTRKLPWDVVTCVNQRNIDHLDAVKDYVYSLGCRHWRLFGIDPMGRAKDISDLQLSDEQFCSLMDFISRCREDGRMQVSYSCEGFLDRYEGRVRNHLYHCAAGLTVASVLIDGSISACTSIRGKYYQGNIYKDDFWEVWQHGFQQYRDRGWMKEKEPCKDCKVWRYCEGNGMHLRDEEGNLLVCHYEKIASL